MVETMMKKMMDTQRISIGDVKVADSVMVRSPGEEPKLLKGDDIDKELVNFGLFIESCDLFDEGLVIVYDSRKSFGIGSKKYIFGQVMVLHKGGVFGTECMTEEEICRAAIVLMDSEVTLNYDGEEFTAYEIG